MNHVHDSQETTRVEDAWYKLCIVAGKPLSDALGDYFAAVFKQIADQRVEHTTVNLDGKTICTYPVVPEGDVPEWCKQVAKENLSGVGYYDRPDLVSRHSERIQKSFEAELTRRVAEATAAKDRRIAELEAECERLNILIQATAEAWLSLEPGVAWEGAIDAAMKAGVGEIQKLRQQLADATRPVEGVEELVELAECSELTKATADKDRRIAELEKSVGAWKRDCETYRTAFDTESVTTRWQKQQLAERDKQIAAERSERIEYQNSLNVLRVFMGKRCTVVGLNDAARTAQWCIEENEKQLAAAQAEVERLKQEIADLHEPPPNMNTGGPVVEVDICEASRISELESDLKHADIRVRSCERREATHLAELTKLREAGATLEEDIRKMSGIITKLREENARLTRPVESVKCGSAATFNQELWVVPHAAFVSERNARESAEAERDELREFVRTRIIESWYRNGEPVFHDAKRVHIMSDANLDELLTAYRAEKAKVQQ